MTKKILITGGAGYIGSHTVLSSLDRGYDVAVVDDLSTGRRSSVPERVKFFEENVANTEEMVSILETFKPDAVIHFAGSIIVSESVENPLKYYFNNTVASLNLINACVKANIKYFIFSSTAAVYGQTEKRKITEKASLSPINPYGKSKLMFENVLRDSAIANDFNYSILRYFNVAGADKQLRTGQSNLRATHLIKLACQTILGMHPSMKVFGNDYDTIDGTCVRDFIHVSDLAEAHLNTLDFMWNNGVNATFNCGNGVGYSVKEILSSVERVSNDKLKVEYIGRRAGDPPYLVADSSKIRNQTKWNAKYKDIDEIIETALKWEQKLQSENI